MAAITAGAAGASLSAGLAAVRTAMQIAAVGVAVETDTALALTPLQALAPGLALEIDTAFALAGVVIGLAIYAAIPSTWRDRTGRAMSRPRQVSTRLRK